MTVETIAAVVVVDGGGMLAGLDQARMSIFIVHVAVWFLVK